MSLLALREGKKANALSASGMLANAHDQREINNENMKQQHRQGQVAGVGSAIGAGAAAGMAFSGPVGWAVGGTLALLSLF